MPRRDGHPTEPIHSPPRTWWRRIPTPIRALFLVDLFLVLAYLGTQFVFTKYMILKFVFDLDNEASFPSWFSVSQLLLVAILLTILAVYVPGRLNKVRIGFTAALFYFLSKEECFGFHELVLLRLAGQSTPEARAASLFPHSTAWPLILGPPLLAAMLILGWRLWGILRVSPQAIRNGIIGLVLFLGGAVGVELTVNLTTMGGVAHRLEIAAEEGCEMAGVTFFLWAAYGLLGAYGVRLAVGPEEKQTPRDGSIPAPHLPEWQDAPAPQSLQNS